MKLQIKMKIEMYDKLEAMCDKLKVEKQLMQSELERLREKHESLLLVTGNYVFNLILFFSNQFQIYSYEDEDEKKRILGFCKAYFTNFAGKDDILSLAIKQNNEQKV
jgi:hypothetical protein